MEAAHKEQIKGEAKAIRVPRGKSDKIPPQAFSFHMEVRHVPVEPGVRIEEIPCRDVHFAPYLQFAMHKFWFKFVCERYGSWRQTTFCFLIVSKRLAAQLEVLKEFFVEML